MAAIIHNSGTNYTLYYNVLNYFKSIMNNHPSIGMVTQGNIVDFDSREFPMYPVGNVTILRADFEGTLTNYEIQLIIADKIKNKNNESNAVTNEQEIPFYGVDDTVDIHANTLGIINDLTSYTAKSVDGFEINDIITNEPFEDRFNNGLAGFVSTFVLTVHNDRDRCLFELLAQPTTTTTCGPTTSTTQAPTTSTTQAPTTSTTLAPTTTTTIAPTTSTTVAPTTSTTLAPTTSTTTQKVTRNLFLGGFDNSTQTNTSNNNPGGFYIGWINNSIYTDTGCSTLAGSRGFVSGSLPVQLNPGPTTFTDGFNTAGWNSNQAYTFASASISDGNGGLDYSTFYTISGSGLYDIGSIFVNVYVGSCTPIQTQPS